MPALEATQAEDNAPSVRQPSYLDSLGDADPASKKAKALEGWLSLTSSNFTKKSEHRVEPPDSQNSPAMANSTSVQGAWQQFLQTPSRQQSVVLSEAGSGLNISAQSFDGSYLQQLQHSDCQISIPNSQFNSPRLMSPFPPASPVFSPHSCHSMREKHEFPSSRIDRPEKAFRSMIVRPPKFSTFEFRRTNGTWVPEGESSKVEESSANSSSSIPSLLDTSSSSVSMENTESELEKTESDLSMICIDDHLDGRQFGGLDSKRWHTPAFLREYKERQESLSQSTPFQNPCWHPDCDYSRLNNDGVFMPPRNFNYVPKSKNGKWKNRKNSRKNKKFPKKEQPKAKPQVVPDMANDFPSLGGPSKATKSRVAAVSKWQSKKMFWGKNKEQPQANNGCPISTDEDRAFAESPKLWDVMSAPSSVPDVPKSPVATQRVPVMTENEFPSL